MKDNIFKDNFLKAKAFIEKMPKKTKTRGSIVLVIVVLFAVITAVVINAQNTKYTTLYTGLSTTEAGSIYGVLNDMGAEVKFDANGNIMVLKSEYDVWILQLAALGYPKTALTYDIFSSNSGMTSTESEKSQWLLYQLQDRIQATLERMDGVVSATVTTTIPETSNYVWETASSEQRASAGVLLTLEPGVGLSGKQVSAIRTLIASSVPMMEPEDVTVVDAGTMLELTPESGSSGEDTSDYSMAFELTVQKQIEDNVARLLAPRYGSGGVVAVAKVTIDYNKMMTEKLEVTPNTDGSGNLTHSEGSYSVNGTVSAGEIVGEETNTDIPTYGNTTPTADGGMTDYNWSSDYDYSYIKTQIESGNAILKRATISVMVNETSLSDTRINELKNLVYGCTDIPVDLISISAFDKSALNEPDETVPTTTDETQENIIQKILALPTWAYIAVGAGFLVLLLLVVVVIAIIKRRKKENYLAEAEEDERNRAKEARRQQTEIDNYKKTLEDIAKGKTDPKNEAIVEEVRDFAKSNPQIAANLIRTWLKEN